jgi:hypothetical protein
MRISLIWRARKLRLAKSLLCLCLYHHVLSTSFAAKSRLERVGKERKSTRLGFSRVAMAADYSYDPLAIVHEAQDITENEACSNTTSDPPQWSRRITRRPLPTYSMAMDEKPPYLSVDSFDSFNSGISTTSSFEKLKKLSNRIRRKPLPRYLRGSIRMHPAADIEPSRVGKGVWKDQLLIDRSIRGMAALMTLLAIGMIILIALYADHFRDRANSNTTSVGGDASSCETVTRTNTACLLLINVCATMILGMSNTYQQLVTSLTITDIKHVLCKFGDSRVGTNSPFSINQKQEGRKRSWAAWLFLVMTSMPVHFLGKFSQTRHLQSRN